MITLRKRSYFLRGTFQWRFLTVSLLYQFIVILIFAAALFGPLMIRLQGAPLSSPETQEVASQFIALHNSVWPALLVTLVLLAVHSAVFSHRIAGPLYRFRTIFKAIADGNLTVSTHIRKGDYLQKEAERLNEMVGSLRARITNMEARCAEIPAVLGELRLAIKNGSAQEMNDSVERLQKHVAHLAMSVGQFRTCETGSETAGSTCSGAPQ